MKVFKIQPLTNLSIQLEIIFKSIKFTYRKRNLWQTVVYTQLALQNRSLLSMLVYCLV